MLRQPIVAVLGHVDHGKTTLLDRIRGTSVAAREPGGITQWIGASLIPAQVLQRICGPLLKQFRFQIVVPGLLFIDTPGHETFSNLRRRGGSAADMAILVVDAVKGVEPQTVESINILKARKTPFVVAANKIDLIPGMKHYEGASFLESYGKQLPEVQRELDNRLYTVIGTLSRLGFRSDRFDRVSDYKTTFAIVPISAKTGEGVPELLAVIVGLTQQFMKDELTTTSGSARGTVLEVKEEVGLGMTVNAIIYDGVLKVDDTVVLGGREKPIVTSVRAILVPKPLDEIRDPRDRFLSVSDVAAASGIKISAPNLDSAIAGSPIYSVAEGEPVDKYVSQVDEEVEEVRIKTDKVGIVLKADTLGSLEAVTNQLSLSGVQVRMADVGDVSKRDVVEAQTVSLQDRFLGVVLSFNVKTLPDAEEEAHRVDVPIFREQILYRLIEQYLDWVEGEKAAEAKVELEHLVMPGKFKVLSGYIFRRSQPAIVGVEVLAGRIKPRYPLILEDGRSIGDILKVQDKGQDVAEASARQEVAVSIDKAVVGRNLLEGDEVYVAVPNKDAKILLTKFREKLSQEEVSLLERLAEIEARG